MIKKLSHNVILSVLCRLASGVILRFQPTVIAVTGSVGKSSAKEAIYQVLHDHFGDKVRSNAGNLNNEIGMPLTILGYESSPSRWLWPFVLIGAYFKVRRLKAYPKFLVLEYGVDKPGDMEYLTSIARPDCAVITSVSAAHLEAFATKHQYQQEKLLLVKDLVADGLAVLNIDDKDLAGFSVEGKEIQTVSMKRKSADYYADILRADLSGTEYRIAGLGHQITVRSKQAGVSAVYASLFAFAIGSNFKIPLLQIGKSLEKIAGLPGRMQIIAGRNGQVIIDDTYNANPTSVRAALDFLASLDAPGRKVAIIGNMNELGQEEVKAHSEIGEYAKSRVDLAIFVGPNASLMAKAFEIEEKAMIFRDRGELELQLNAILRSSDVILVKASQNGNYLEEVVKQLMQNPAEAGKLLVRQSKRWMKIKKCESAKY